MKITEGVIKMYLSICRVRNFVFFFFNKNTPRKDIFQSEGVAKKSRRHQMEVLEPVPEWKGRESWKWYHNNFRGRKPRTRGLKFDLLYGQPPIICWLVLLTSRTSTLLQHREIYNGTILSFWSYQRTFWKFILINLIVKCHTTPKNWHFLVQFLELKDWKV